MEITPALTDILFLDIETVSCVANYESLHDRLKPLWDKKSLFLKQEGTSCEALFFERAGIYAEFGKIVAIAVGVFHKNEFGELSLRIKAIASDNEKVLLLEFKELLESKFDADTLHLCAHNGKEFDFPYICRRMTCHGITLPKVLEIAGKKPWEVKHLDTLEMWKFGDRKNYTSLELLAALFDIDTSKEAIDGSMVNHVYHVEKDLDKIAAYCKLDVLVIAKLYLKLKCLPGIQQENIFIL